MTHWHLLIGTMFVGSLGIFVLWFLLIICEVLHEEETGKPGDYRRWVMLLMLAALLIATAMLLLLTGCGSLTMATARPSPLSPQSVINSTQGGTAPSLVHTQTVAGSTPAPATNSAGTPLGRAIAPPPPMPPGFTTNTQGETVSSEGYNLAPGGSTPPPATIVTNFIILPITPGRTNGFALQVSSDLMNWTTITNYPASTPAAGRFAFIETATNNSRFYRLKFNP